MSIEKSRHYCHAAKLWEELRRGEGEGEWRGSDGDGDGRET